MALAVLEVGTFHGGTLYHWVRNAYGCAVVVSVDTYDAGVDNRELYSTWAVKDNVTVHAIEGVSQAEATVAEVARFAPFDFVFIDGDHSYEGVKADWECYRPLVASGGIVAFHDILPPTVAWPDIEVDRLWREIQREGYVTRELVENARADWGGIGVVWVP